MLSTYITYLIGLITSFFSLQFADIDGNIVSMNTFQGKKILLVNISIDSAKAHQLDQLQQLQEQLPDSLVVIAFPSNSFGHANVADSTIRRICVTDHHATFVIASKVNVAGSNIHPVFDWLAHKAQNGSINAAALGDFQKFLIDKDGTIKAVLSPKIPPLDPGMIEAITATD
jgi:glutathione peroxidase